MKLSGAPGWSAIKVGLAGLAWKYSFPPRQRIGGRSETSYGLQS